MTASTRAQFISAATPLFAERGFYGVSIAAIARELGLTKQALLHHFGSKEQLYAEVLMSISAHLGARLQHIIDAEPDPARQLEAVIIAHYQDQMDNTDAARLIMRELLDNEQRAERAGSWYLQDYLEHLLDTVLKIKPGHNRDRSRALAMIYQLLGSVHFFAVSQPTLANMFGQETLNDTGKHFEEELRLLVRARLRADEKQLTRG